MQHIFYLTTYKKHYVQKNIKPTSQNKPVQEFADPVTIAHKKYLVVHKTPSLPEENAEIYLDNFKNKPKALGNTPLEVDIITNLKGKPTEYQESFCYFEMKDLYSKEDFRLEEDAQIPLTTYTSYYKNPLSYNPKALNRVNAIKYPDNLSTNEELNKLLEIKTGVSEYMGDIGEVGSLIVRSRF